MANNDILGIQATINGADVQRGANQFISQVSRMENVSDKFINSLSQNMKIANGQIMSMGNSFASVSDSIVSKLGMIGVAFSAQQFAQKAMMIRGDFQQLEIAFTTMLGSADKANELMNQLINTAAKTPFDLKGVANGAKQLLAYGVASEKVNETLVRLGDISAGLSIPLNDMVYLYGTTMTQGRLFTQDLRQFQGRGIPLADELAKQFGVTKDKVGELVTAGRVGFPEVQKAIESMTNAGGKFGGLMSEQSKSITGQISNIQDALDMMFNEIGKSSEGVINKGLEGVSYLVDHWRQVGEAIGVAAAAYGTYKAAEMTTAAISNLGQAYNEAELIKGYESLLAVQQESIDADLAEAVSKGRLSQESAVQVAALRQEVSERMKVLAAQKAQALAEEETALAALQSAQEKKDAADSYLESMQNLYDAALEQGDATYQNYAYEQLATATTNANTAATELNTAQKNYNAASTKAKTATTAADTFAEQANTVATNAHTASVGLLRGAYLQLIAIMKSAWATMMANPLGIVVAAVTALGYGIYKLITYETELDKINKRLKDSISDATKAYTQEISSLNRLKGELEGLTKGSKEYEDVKKKIIDEYGKYYDGLEEEINRVGLTEQAYNKLTEAIEKSANARQYNLFVQKEEEALSSITSTNLSNIRERLVDKLGEGKGMEMYSKLTAKVISGQLTQGKDFISVNGLGSELQQTLDKVAGTGIIRNREIEGWLLDIIKAQKNNKMIIEEAKKAFGTDGVTKIDNPVESYSPKYTSSQLIAKYKQEYLKAQSDLDNFIKSETKLKEDEWQKEYERLSSELSQKKDQYEKYSGRTMKEEDKESQELDKYKLLVDKQAREKKRSEEDAQLSIDEAWVSMQEDSLQKRLNILGLNYDKQMMQLERQQEDELIKLIEDERTKFEANPANKGKKFDPTGIELSPEIISKYNAQRKQLMDSFLKENDKMSKEVEQKYQSDAQKRLEIEKRYNKDIEELNRQRTEAEQRGDTERVQNLESSIRKATVEKAKSLLSFDFDLLKQSPEYVSAYEDLSNISTQTLEYLISEFEKVKASASSSLNPEDLREYTQTLQDMYDELNSRNPFRAITEAMNELNASRNTLRELSDIINGKKSASKIDNKGGKLTALYEYTDENGEKKIITYSEALEKYGKLLDNTLKKENKAKKSITEVSVAFSTLGSEISNLGNAIGGTAGEVVSLIGDVMTFASSTIQGIQSLSTATAGAMAAIEKASVILAIASAALQILQKISSLGTNKAFKQYEAYAEKIKDINALTDAVNQYKYAILEARNEESNWFSVDSLRNLKDYKEMQQQALKAYQDKALESQAIYQNKSGGGWLTGAFNWMMGNLSLLSPFEWWKNIWGQGSYGKGQTAAINNLRIETRKASSGFLGSGIGGKSQKTEDLQIWINQNKDKFKGLDTNLFDNETGLINKELANAIIENYGDKLVGQTKETLESLIKLREQYDEYLQQLHEYVSSLYEPLVDNFIDSLWDWFDNGKDALKSFKDYASDTFRDIVTDMMRTIVLEKVVGGFSDDIANLYEKYSVGQLSEDELMKKVSERMSGLIEDYETQIPVLQEMMNQMNGYLESAGLNMRDSSYSQEASSKGFQAMSQDTGEELNGRFTALQIAGEEIKAQSMMQTEFVKYISQDTSAIKFQIAWNTKQISEMIDIQHESNEHLSAIQKNTNQLYEMNDRLDKIEKNTRNL